jgi:hypothetical protein
LTRNRAEQSDQHGKPTTVRGAIVRARPSGLFKAIEVTEQK